MNLSGDPWAPVIYQDRTVKLVSLKTLYEDAERIRDLSVNPPQRIALMRLLICITQAALDGPEDEEDWINCRDRIVPESLAYLEKSHEAFELHGDRPFMQIPGLGCKKGETKPLKTLDFRSPWGGSGSVHFAREDTRALLEPSNEDDALNLLCLLNFSNGGRVGQSIWNGVHYSDSTFAAPCIKVAHTFLRGRDLLDTIRFNLLSKHGDANSVSGLPNGKWGRPVWEQFPRNVEDSAAFANAAKTYLGRLVPLSRFVNLKSEAPNQCIVGPPHKAFRIEHLPAYREPSITVMRSKKDEPYYLRLSSARHMWRDLGSVLAAKADGGVGQCPLCVSCASRYAHLFPDDTLDLWVGGLELGDTAGKLNDMLEWVFSVPIDLLHETELGKYREGVELAEEGERALLRAVMVVWKDGLHVDAKNVPREAAATHYWSDMDLASGQLVEAAKRQEVDLEGPWLETIKASMRAAYDHVCPKTTPRQIQAYAHGLRALRLRRKDKK